MGRLEDKVAVVTGSGQGIGKAIAKLFASEGASIVVNALHEDSAQETAREIEAAGGNVAICVADVRKPEAAQRIIDTAAEKFGKLDILVNNAGLPLDSLINKMSDSQWDDCLDVTLKGAFNCTRAASKYMMKEGHGGRIINVSAAAGLIGARGMANYVTAKTGIIGFTRAMAREWLEFGITCNAIAYGWVDTRLTGERETGEEVLGHKVGIPKKVRDTLIDQYPGRRMSPDDAARIALLLALPEAELVTGNVINATGGWLI